MERFRKLPSNIFFKVFLGILLFTFVFFGVADFIFNSGKYNVATVGEKNIGINQFYRILNKERNAIIRNNPQGLESDYINSKEFSLSVLRQEITSMLLKKEVLDFYLMPKDDAIIEGIVVNPVFADANGNFDKNRFSMFLRNAEFREKDYIDYLKDSISKRTLVSAISNTMMISNSISEKVYKNRAEKRKVDIITIDKSSINEKISRPTNKEIEQFYNSNTKLFYRPEYRKVYYLEINPIDVFPDKSLNITESDLRNEYNVRSSEYIQPEKRSIYFIRLEEEEKIKNVKNKLDNGESFVTLAKEVSGLPESDFKIENVTLGTFDAGLSDVVFGMGKDEYSDIITRNGEFIIVYVYDIKPMEQLTFNEVRSEIKVRLINQKREDLFSDYIMKLEDKLLLASNIGDIAQELGLKVSSAGKFTAEGMDDNGKEIKEISKVKNFVNTAFELNEQTFSDLIYENNKYYVLFLDEISPEGVLNFDNAKNEARKMIIDEKINAKVKELAEKVEKQLRSTPNTTMVSIRNQLKLDENVVVSKINSKYSKNFVSEVFALNRDDYISDLIQDGSGVYKIAILDQIIKVDSASREQVQLVKNELNYSIYEDVLSKYMQHLEKKVGVSINSKNLQQFE